MYIFIARLVRSCLLLPQVWRNGLVTFGVDSLSSDLSKPTLNLSMVDADYFVAPLWLPGVISSRLVNSTVSWQQQREGEPGFILELASNAVTDFSESFYRRSTEFQPTWAAIVDWNVTLSPSSEERLEICRDYRTCLCEDNIDSYYYYDEYYYFYNERSGGGPGSGCNPDPDCHSNLGWSPHDVNYLSLLCERYQNHFYRYNHIGVRPHPFIFPPLLHCSNLFHRSTSSCYWLQMDQILMLFLFISKIVCFIIMWLPLLSSTTTPQLDIA